MKHDTLAPWAEPAPNAKVPMTADELLHLPRDGWQYELVEGRLVRMPPVGSWRGGYSSRLDRALGNYVDDHQLGIVLVGEPGFTLSQPGQPDTVLAPDIAFVAGDRAPAEGSPEGSGFWRMAPDLAIEVVSPSQFHPEMAEKARAWLAAGVRLVWMVWPAAKQVEVWIGGHDEPVATLGIGNALDGRDIVPGFSYPVASLFA